MHIIAKVFSIQIFQYLRQIPPRVCTLVLFILTVTVLCVCVCLFIVFCHHVHLDPEMQVCTCSLQHGKNLNNIIMIFANNGLSTKKGIPMESIQRGHGITICNFN